MNRAGSFRRCWGPSTSGRTPPSRPRRPATCLVRADRELGRSVGNDVTGWIERMEQTRTEARRCVATYVQLRADLFDDVATRVRGLSETPEGPGLRPPPPLAPQDSVDCVTMSRDWTPGLPRWRRSAAM